MGEVKEVAKKQKAQSGAETTDVQKEIPETGTSESSATVEAAAGGDQTGQADTLPEKESPLLKPACTWANENRLATWQTALLLKAAGWLPDKKVSEEEFNRAMAASIKRKQGGIHG